MTADFQVFLLQMTDYVTSPHCDLPACTYIKSVIVERGSDMWISERWHDQMCVFICVCVGGVRGGLQSVLCRVGGVWSQSAQAWRSELLDRVQSFAEQSVLGAGSGEQTDTLQ